uniref:NPH3 domain-containing protein n=1 Tax=Zea mays TaxID=4577 RepID=A0A804Q3V9_MAIZE
MEPEEGKQRKRGRYRLLSRRRAWMTLPPLPHPARQPNLCSRTPVKPPLPERPHASNPRSRTPARVDDLAPATDSRTPRRPPLPKRRISREIRPGRGASHIVVRVGALPAAGEPHDHVAEEAAPPKSLVAALPPDPPAGGSGCCAAAVADDGITCDFLLKLLRAGSMVGADTTLLRDLEARVARRLDQATLGAVDGGGGSKAARVARLVDVYLAEAALEAGLRPAEFEELARAVPAHARPADDALYRAVDTYLKVRPRSALS